MRTPVDDQRSGRSGTETEGQSSHRKLTAALETQGRTEAMHPSPSHEELSANIRVPKLKTLEEEDVAPAAEEKGELIQEKTLEQRTMGATFSQSPGKKWNTNVFERLWEDVAHRIEKQKELKEVMSGHERS